MKTLSAVFVVCLCFRSVFASVWNVFADEEDGTSASGWSDTEGSGDFFFRMPDVDVDTTHQTLTTTPVVDVSTDYVRALLSRMDMLDKRIMELESQIKGQHATIKELEHKMIVQEENAVQLITKSNLTDKKILELENKNKAVDKKISTCTTKSNATFEKLVKVENSNRIVTKKITDLEKENRAVVKKINGNEQSMMRNVLVFMNVPEYKNKDYVEILRSVVLGTLNQAMGLIIDFEDIADVRRDDSEDVLRSLDEADEDNDLLRNRSSLSSRPIVVTFVNYLTKRRVLEANARLEHANFKVSDVYGEFVNQRRKALRPYVVEKRRQGRGAELQDDKLVLDGETTMTLEQLKAGQKKVMTKTKTIL